MVKLQSIVLSLIISGGLSAQSSQLTEGDRQALKEALAVLQQNIEERAQKQAGSAYKAFKEAAESESKALELYLKCSEKVHFLDEKRDGQSFREWKRKFDEHMGSSKPFQRLLQHQLNWLVLNLDAGRATEETHSLIAKRAMDSIDRIISEGDLWQERVKKMDGKQVTLLNLLKESVFDSVYVKAYEVKRTENWPGSPIVFNELYDSVVLKQYESPEHIDNFREAWLKRIEQEGLFAEATGRKPSGGGKTAALEKFISLRRPQLLWELEARVYKMGQQREAASNMIGHFDKYEGHPNEAMWHEELKSLLQKMQPWNMAAWRESLGVFMKNDSLFTGFCDVAKTNLSHQDTAKRSGVKYDWPLW